MKIEIYSSNTCTYCQAAKEFFKEQGLEYIEYNISEDIAAKKTLMKKGFMSVPLIVIDGENVVGFDKEKIEKLINK